MRSLWILARLVLLSFLSFLSLGAGPGLAAPSFQGLGTLDPSNPYSVATGVSADGSLVVGQSRGADGFVHGFVYQDGTGMQSIGLPELAGGEARTNATHGAYAWGISADGSTIVGDHRFEVDGLCFPCEDAFAYDVQAGTWSLRSGADWGVRYHAASADGSIRVGEEYYWARDPDAIAEGPFPKFNPAGNVNTGSIAWDVNADGSVIVGGILDVDPDDPYGTFGRYQPYRWDAVNGTVIAFGVAGQALGVSADGSTVVGNAGSDAFRWTTGDGLVPLAGLPGGAGSDRALDASSNGSVIVGSAHDGTSNVAFVWDADDGMRALLDILELNGIDMTGWELVEASQVSANGRTVVGYGINPAGETEAFVATIPEPATAALVGVGLAVLAARRRRVRAA